MKRHGIEFGEDSPPKKRLKQSTGGNIDQYYTQPISCSSKLPKDKIVESTPFITKQFTSKLATSQYQACQLGSICIGKNGRKKGHQNRLNYSKNNRICPSKIMEILKLINYNTPSIDVCVASDEKEEKICKCGISQNLFAITDCKALNVSSLDNQLVPVSSLDIYINDCFALRMFIQSTTPSVMVKYSGCKVECFVCVLCFFSCLSEWL